MIALNYLAFFSSTLSRFAILATVCLLTAQLGHGQDSESVPQYFGPILTWDGDPTETMTITWVESTGGARARATANNRWRRGPSGFGYGDKDDATVLEDMKGKYTRVYIRRVFELEDVADEPAILRVRYDDAFIAYLNGKEIEREEIEKGNGPDAKKVGKHEAKDDEFDSYEIKNWKDIAKKGKNVLAVEGHNETKESSDFTLDVYLDRNKDEDDDPIIDKGDRWTYLAGGDPKEDWNQVDFKPRRAGSGDAGGNGKWKQGKSGFGYADDDDETEIEPAGRGRLRARLMHLFIRKKFTLKDVKDSGKLRIRYDDAFIAYLNGKEIRRVGVKGKGTKVSDVVSHDAEKDKFDEFDIKDWSDLAVEGENVLAIEGHNVGPRSSDFTLDAYLESDDKKVIEKNATWDYLAFANPGDDWTKVDYDSSSGDGSSSDDKDDDVEDTPLPSKEVSEDRERKANRVFYRTAGEGDWLPVTGSRRSFGNTEDIVRTVQLTGLKPNTEYEFLLGGRTPRRKDIRKFRTATEDPEDEEVTFVTGGDMSTSEKAQEMNRLVGKLDPMFALLGGDLAYANGKNVLLWHKWLNAWSENAITKDGCIVPMVVAIGNHETGSKLSSKLATQLGVPKNSQFFYSLFKLPGGRTNYAMDFGDYLSVFVLDSGHSQDEKDQAQWLNKSLEDHEDVPTRVICYHEPAYGTAKKANKEIIEHWVPLFEKHKVTVVFENDHHALKRTHRLKGGEKSDDGVLYLGDGAWGVGTREIKDRDERKHLAKAEKENHIWQVTIKDGKASYRALDEDGKELDKYPE